MKSGHKLIIVVYCLSLFLPLWGQDKADIYMNNPTQAIIDAKTRFVLGDYKQVISLVGLYSALSDIPLSSESQDMLKKAQSCQSLIEKAILSEAQNNWKEAAEFYREVLSINSEDSITKEKYEQAQKKSSVVYYSVRGVYTGRVERVSERKDGGLRVGEKKDGYVICYLDSTGDHGWLMDNSYSNKTFGYGGPYSNSEWRCPSLEEMRVIYQNRFSLGLNGIYWTSTRSKKVANWEFFYTFDFGTGKEKSTSYDKLNYSFRIKNF